MNLFSYRQVNAWAFLLCGLYLGISFFLEHYSALPPCPLCVLQRYVFILLLIVFLIGSVYARTLFTSRFFGILTFSVSLIGIFLSGRQLWLLKNSIEPTGVCAPNLSYLFKQLPVMDAIKVLVLGSGDCVTTMSESFLGISIPYWTFFGFLFLMLISVWQIIRKIHFKI